MFIYRYLSYVMDVATPTADCLTLVYELLLPVILKGNCKSTLSHQEVKPSPYFQHQTFFSVVVMFMVV